MLLLISMSESQESRDEKMRSVDSDLASNISNSILIILMSRPWQPGVARDEAGRCDAIVMWHRDTGSDEPDKTPRPGD